MQHPSQPPYPMAPYPPGSYQYYPGYPPQQVPPHGAQPPPHGAQPPPQQVPGPPQGPPTGYYQTSQPLPPPYSMGPPPQHPQQQSPHMYPQPAYGHQPPPPHWGVPPPPHGPPPSHGPPPHGSPHGPPHGQTQPSQMTPHGATHSTGAPPPPQPHGPPPPSHQAGYYQPTQPPSSYMPPPPPQHQQGHPGQPQMYPQPTYGHQPPPHWVHGPHPQMMQPPPHQPQQFPPHPSQAQQFPSHGPQAQQFPPHGLPPPQQQMPPHGHPPQQQIASHGPQPPQQMPPHGPPPSAYYQPSQQGPPYMGPPPQHPAHHQQHPPSMQQQQHPQQQPQNHPQPPQPPSQPQPQQPQSHPQQQQQQQHQQQQQQHQQQQQQQHHHQQQHHPSALLHHHPHHPHHPQQAQHHPQHQQQHTPHQHPQHHPQQHPPSGLPQPAQQHSQPHPQHPSQQPPHPHQPLTQPPSSHPQSHIHQASSPHHPPSRTHTPQHPPTSQTPTRVVPPPVVPSGINTTSASPSNQLKVIEKPKQDVITFPKNSVENTKPIAIRKRKFTSKDVSDVEVWRLLMCLKSGLLAESSWAIDVLSILLNDDATLMYFSLQNTPGLLEAVLEHFKCSLNEIFDGIVKDTYLEPISDQHKKKSDKKQNDNLKNDILNDNNKHNDLNGKSNLCHNHVNPNNGKTKTNNINNNNLNTKNNNINDISGHNGNSNGSTKAVINNKKERIKQENENTKSQAANYITIPCIDEKLTIFKSDKNYTFKTRDGKSVELAKVHNPETNEIETRPAQDGDDDILSKKLVFDPVGYSHWQEGKGEDTSHIQVRFEPNNFIELSKRCVCLSTILRNLSFIPNNDVEMSRHAGLLLVLGRLLLLKHDLSGEPESQPNEWHLANSLREDTLVIISNISSSLDLSPFNDKINLTLLNSLLHWACSQSNYALDPYPPPSVDVTPQRLALESLAKLSIIEGNVDLILATPPWSRIEELFQVLTRLLNSNEEQTVREFSLVLLSNLTSADSGIARRVALTDSAITRLISFLETSLINSEESTTTQDMLRRAAQTLKYLSHLVDNHSLFAKHQQRLLNLVMSHKLDQEIAPLVADVIFEISLSC